MMLRLACFDDGAASHLEIQNGSLREEAKSDSSSLENRLSSLLDLHRPLPRTRLREELRVNNHRLGEALCAMEKAGKIRRTAEGWLLNVSHIAKEST
jgi:hypothetical protein